MRILALLLAGLCALPVMRTAAAQEALGVNYNQFLSHVDEAALDRLDALWVRGFIGMHRLGSDAPAEQANLRGLETAIRTGHKTILSLKWDYRQQAFPEPGSAGMARELAVLNRLLPEVMGKVDMLVIGNEPFIEARRDQADTPDLNLFYETMARAVIDYRRLECGPSCKTTLYMGALNRLDLPAWRTPAVERMLRYTRETPEIAGIDLHAHLPGIDANRSMLDYVLPKLRPEQKFLVTEFSVVPVWRRHLQDRIGPAFAARYQLPPDLLVYQLIDRALQAPVPFGEWRDFLRSSPWFMAHRDDMVDAYKLYRATGRLAVVNHGIEQNWTAGRHFGKADVPWVLNGLYASSTVQPEPGGASHFNFPWAEQFRAIQAERNGG